MNAETVVSARYLMERYPAPKETKRDTLEGSQMTVDTSAQADQRRCKNG